MVTKLSHHHNQTPSLVLTCCADREHLLVFPQNPFLSDHFLFTFEITIKDYAHFGLKNNLKNLLP